jgi:hypothetical protein
MKPELLSVEEIQEARETRFLDGSFDKYQRFTRGKVLTLEGLADAYRRDATVAASFQSYLSGKTTLQGSLLLAYRALALRQTQILQTLVEYECPQAVEAPEPQTIESVTASKVRALLSVCDRLFAMCSKAISHESPQHFWKRMGFIRS